MDRLIYAYRAEDDTGGVLYHIRRAGAVARTMCGIDRPWQAHLEGHDALPQPMCPSCSQAWTLANPPADASDAPGPLRWPHDSEGTPVEPDSDPEIDGNGMDAVDRAFLSSLVPDNAIPVGFIAIAVWLDEDGVQRFRWYAPINLPISGTLGIMEMAKASVMAQMFGPNGPGGIEAE